MDELEKLYAVLKRDGYYTKPFTDFVRQFDDQSYRDKVYSVVSRDKLYTGSPEEFSAKYYNAELIQETVASEEEAASYNQELELAQQQYEDLKKEQLKRLESERIAEEIREKRKAQLERGIMPPEQTPEEEADILANALAQFGTNYEAAKRRVPDDYAEQKYKSPQQLSLEIKDKGYDFETDDEYYAQFSTGDGSFIDTHFGKEKLNAMNIDPKAFEGFMEQTGRKSDLQDKYSKGFYEDKFRLLAAQRGVDRALQYDLDRKAALDDYFESLLTRKKEKQSLQQQRDNGGKLVRPSANQKVNLGIDGNNYRNYLKTDFRVYDERLREQKAQQQEDYQKYKNDNLGKGLFSFKKVGSTIDDFAETIDASIYGFLGDVTGSDYLKSVAEGVADEAFQESVFAPPTYSYSKAEGKPVTYNDQQYVVDKNGQVYNTDQELIVTSLLNETDYKNILAESEKTDENVVDVSLVGGMVNFSAVLTDLLLQIGYTAATVAGPGKFAKALKVGQLGTRGQKIYNTLSKIPSLPVKQSVVNSVIAQSQIGYGRGYTDTYVAAKEAGLTDSKAKELANTAAQQTGIWYGITAPIATQGKAINALLGEKAKTTIKQAVKNFVKTGSKKNFTDILTSMARGGKVFGITGMREAVQENVQEFGNVYKINKDVNEAAGQKILRDTITMADVAETTLLSFLAGGLAGTIGSMAQSNQRQKSMFDFGTKNSSSKMNALGLLTNEYDKSVDVANGMVANSTMTQSQADDLVNMMESYRTSVGSMPETTTPETAEVILPKLSELRALENEKENTDTVFHPAIDKKIEKIKEEISISVIYDQLPSAERLTLKNQAENILTKELKPSEINDKAIYDKVIEILTPKIPKDAVSKQEAGDISITEPTPALQEVEEEVRVSPEEEVEEEIISSLTEEQRSAYNNADEETKADIREVLRDESYLQSIQAIEETMPGGLSLEEQIDWNIENKLYQESADTIKEVNDKLGITTKADEQVFTFGTTKYDIDKAESIIKNEDVQLRDIPVDVLPKLSYAFVLKTEKGIQDADINSPVVIAQTEKGLLLIDGHHRVEKAIRDNKSIKAHILSESQTKEVLLTPTEEVETKIKDDAKPTIKTPPGSRLFNKPLEDATTIANRISERTGIDYEEAKRITKLDVPRAIKIAQAFEALESDPNNPEVQEAYQALIDETIEQYNAIIESGYTLEVNNEEPYDSSQDMIDDLRNNKNLKIFSTESGFGEGGVTDSDRESNPLLAPTEFTDKNGVPLLANDIFRFVHDFFGHAKMGNGFGPVGEENAWNVHSRMYSPKARRAMTTETRGQNSWVNFSGVNEDAFKLRDEARRLRKEGKFDEALEKVDEAYRLMRFADQKIGLLPVEFSKTDDDIVSERKEMASARRKAAKVVPTPKRKKVTVDEAAALRDQIRLEARAARESKQSQDQKRKAIADKIRGFVRDGSITSKQASSIINRISKINLDNPKSVNNALAYAEKVMIDAENDKKLSDSQSIRKKIKKASKGEKVDAIVAESAKNFALINPNTVEDIDLYLDNAKKVLDGLRTSRIKGTGIDIKPTFDVNEINQYTSKSLEREIEIENELFKQNFEDVTGLNADEFSALEMRDILYSEDTTQEQIDNKANKRQELIRRAINNAFDRYSSVANSMLKKGTDPFTGESLQISEDAKSRVKRFLKIDIDKLSNSEALRAIDSLVNFLTNLSTAGMDVVIGRDSGEDAAQLLANKGFKARNVKSLGRLWNTWISSLPNFYQYIFTSPSQAREFDKQIGTRAYVDGAATAETETNKKVDDFIKKFKKTKPNRKPFNSVENITERGMGAFMMRSVDNDSQVEFDRRKKLIEQSIEKLSQGNEVEVRKSKDYQDAYDKILKESNSLQDVREKMDNTNLQAVEFVQDMWSEIYEDLSDVSLNVYNSVLGRDSNYTTDTFGRIEKVEDVEELGAPAYGDTRKRVYDKKTGVLEPTVRPVNLPKGRVVDLSFDSNNFSAYKRALIDINTAETTQRIIGFLNSDAFKKVVPSKEVREIVRDRINLIVDAKRNVSKPYNDNYRNIVNGINTVSKLGYARVLAGPTQFIKQLTPFVNTLINAGPENTSIAIALMANKNVQNAINNSGKPIANRGLSSQSTIKLDSRLESEANSMFVKYLLMPKLGEASLKLFLVAPDRFAARASFLAYYIQELSRKGVDISGIDWSTHKIEGDAAAKAQFEVDRQQNISDSDIQGELFSSKNPGAQIVRKVLFAFASFQMNQKTRAFNDIRTLLSRTASAQDRVDAGRSISSLPAESVTFQTMGYIITSILSSIALGLIAYDEDDEEAYKRESNSIKGRFRNLATDMISPVPALDDTLIRFINVFAEQEEKLFVGDKEDILRSLGTIGIAPAKGIELINIASIINRGTVKREFFGRETEKKLTDEAIENLKMALTIKTLHNVGLLPPEADYIAGVVVKKSKKMTEEKKKKSKPKKIKMSVLKDLNPELYNQIKRSKEELKASSGNDILRQTAVKPSSMGQSTLKETPVK